MTSAKRKLKLGQPIPVGRNDWHITTGATSSQVLQALGNLVRRMDSRDVDAG
jgi:hypothetical protein